MEQNRKDCFPRATMYTIPAPTFDKASPAFTPPICSNADRLEYQDALALERRAPARYH